MIDSSDQSIGLIPNEVDNKMFKPQTVWCSSCCQRSEHHEGVGMVRCVQVRCLWCVIVHRICSMSRQRIHKLRMCAMVLLLSMTSLFLLPFGASVLKPDLDLYFGETEGRGDAVALKHRQIVAVLEASLQDAQLIQCERGADALRFPLRTWNTGDVWICWFWRWSRLGTVFIHSFTWNIRRKEVVRTL